MNIISLSLYSVALIRTYSENCLFLQEGEYLRAYFILSMYSSFRNVRHFPRCAANSQMSESTQHQSYLERSEALSSCVFSCQGLCKRNPHSYHNKII